MTAGDYIAVAIGHVAVTMIVHLFLAHPQTYAPEERVDSGESSVDLRWAEGFEV